ncbi:mediator of DNA damage checkpoint protein 1-like isoform X2 [Eriocheir sinensis]|uniref:mediator of DNA damage checkpoint protein 1-like isoform X2 n=1 Tax=Eriocheir sinensis TaxID=95602 RepID=UPI0021C94FDB|nr:mediator of DNA damage checkpoint protein 1-like isoform X2 [Eriocheir sinensis]
MTEVVLNDPADSQSLMSLSRDVAEGGGALIPASHPGRVRKVRPSQLKGKRVSDKNMTQKTTQYKDYLSEQRSKRLSRQKVRGRDGAKKSKGKVTQQENAAEKEEEEGEKVDASDMNGEDTGESRLVSAGSDTSKDEGISSNGEKDEDFETDTQEVLAGQPDDDEDEGRGSIKDEGEEPPDDPDQEVPGDPEAPPAEPEVEPEAPAEPDAELDAEPEAEPEEAPADPEPELEEPTAEPEVEPEAPPADPEPEPEEPAAEPEVEPEAPPAEPEPEPEEPPAEPEPEPEAPPAEPEAEPEEPLAEPEPEPEEAPAEPEPEPEEAPAEPEPEPEDPSAEPEAEPEDPPVEPELEPEEPAAEPEPEPEAPAAEPEPEPEGELEAPLADPEVEPEAPPAEPEAAPEGGEEAAAEESQQEEEITEDPALAKVPRKKSKRVTISPRKPESDVTKTPRRKPHDPSKVMATRKPISWRPGPIQATSKKSDISKPNQKKFKAKKPSEVSITIDEEKEIKISPVETVNEGVEEESSGEVDAAELSVPLNLDTFRSEGHLDTLAEDEPPLLEKSESLPELQRPSTAGNKNKISKRKKARPRINSTWKKEEWSALLSHRSSTSHGAAADGGSTSEVWVPDENRLYVYTYSSEPRLLHVRRLGSRRGVVTTDLFDHDPNSSFRLRTRGNGNPMYDRRVVRGSNYAKRLGGEEMPKWNPYFTNARSLENINKGEPEAYNQRRQEFREKLEARARLRRESHGMSSLYPSHTSHARHRAHSHTHAQTENYYEPLERPPEAEVGIQTEGWGEDGASPPVVFQSPPGVDVSTQLYDEESGAMAVAALVARTLREAAVEVLMEEKEEEERLKKMKDELLGKGVSAGEEQPEENSIEAEEKEGEEGEERTDPEGKETSPLDTEEPARSPELSEDVEKDAALPEDEGTPQEPPPEIAGLETSLSGFWCAMTGRKRRAERAKERERRGMRAVTSWGGHTLGWRRVVAQEEVECESRSHSCLAHQF